MPLSAVERYGRIVRIAIPITLGMLSQNVLNLIDTAMLGRVNDQALAAAGMASMAFWLFAAPSIGLGSAVHALTASRAGSGQRDTAAVPVVTALATIAVIAIPWTGLSLLIGRPLFSGMAADADWAATGFLDRVDAGAVDLN